MTYYLGIDGGGTNTRCTLYDQEGTKIDTLTLPSIHFMKVSPKQMSDTLNEAKQYFKKTNHSIKVALGLGGYGANEDIRKLIETAVYSVFPSALIMNDAQLALHASLGQDDGIFLISGTGSIALYQKDKIQTRRGGFGYLIGDEGSAFWIGKKILERFTQEVDTRIPRTDLYEKMMTHLKLNSPQDIIKVIADQNDNYRNFLAQLSYTMKDCEGVEDIYTQAGHELARLANSFQYEKSTPLAIGGSVLQNNNIVRNSLIKNLNPDLAFINTPHEAEYAAYRLLKDSQ